MDREDQKWMSLKLSSVLEDIGVSRQMIDKRRWTWRMMETVSTITLRMKDNSKAAYHYGSQTEGTTTNGMESDYDTLLCCYRQPVILNLGKWQQGNYNLLVLKTEHSPPQQCFLQVFRHDSPSPETRETPPFEMKDSEGRVLLNKSEEGVEGVYRTCNRSGKLFKHGPSRSGHENYDIVIAFYCASLPEECQFLFERPRPGHWPRHDTLARARQTGVFLVQQGYTEPLLTKCKLPKALLVNPNDPIYPKTKWEWRFSTPQMERLLMFDMNTVQLKTYVLIKIIRKSFFKPVFEDRLSTFHCKTAMLWTIETFPAAIWKENNLVQCVIYCLNTLLRWLKMKYCPHYTISNVNLFTSKLLKYELKVITGMITSMITSDLQCIYKIEMDSIGARMSAEYVHAINTGNMIWFEIDLSVISDLVSSFTGRFQAEINSLLVENTSLEWHQYVQSISQDITKLASISERGSNLEQESASLLIPHRCCTLASVQASRCIQQGKPITQDVYKLYQRSFDKAPLSNRLKAASMLFCSGQYETAENCLTYCESLLGPKVWQICRCKESGCKFLNYFFLLNALIEYSTDILTNCICFCIYLSRHETFCIPEFLQYEMFKTISEEDRQQRQQTQHGFPEWMDMVVVDCFPFLYYLQFLTYRQLGLHVRSFETYLKLSKYVLNSQGHGHVDTAMNMLGDCCERLGWLDHAWFFYGNSLRLYPRNNAANWHVARLLHRRIDNGFRLCQ
ncbi:uncharacterized protein LOC128218244 [Mya arenaria]|uniref:uncharacterized protein LOC128218244 n=1 Tax=Mya arenaria TaxID=6604 RepID=UPI0022E26025|nr:uncharacterized protein LOC128218244 [Mya arenaria]XP_052781815.1 uncharacterized protein LOC128218244 [Mya arenaria]